MVEIVIGFVKALKPEYLSIGFFMVLIPVAIWTRHAADATNGQALKWTAFPSLAFLVFVGLGGASEAMGQGTVMYTAEITRAVVDGHRLDAVPIVDLGFAAVLLQIVGETWIDFADNPLRAVSAVVILLGTGSAASIHLWRATQGDLPAIKWRHACGGALVSIAVWVLGISLSTSQMEPLQREGLTRVAALQTKNCPDLSTPCPLRRGPNGG